MISQREAQRLKKRVEVLEEELSKQRRHWCSEWPGGVHVDTVDVKSEEYHIAKTARKLGHAVVVVPQWNDGKGRFLVYALSLPSNV